ncbi:hypothetical protein [uncultured Tenacibaculum sp.]|uniref:hypothetical protein n=1 Tax=uncultured Tenacibaculum sp. TaxID=174713 RepID=UPI00262D1724|nr:hypothetical protein [uncultured Tenacibaculum sp.]
MKKSILNLGKVLSRTEQKKIDGGGFGPLKPRRCCDPALQCCTTSHLALNNPSCGGTYMSGCQYHPANGCCI